ncbi:hypothetical protein EYR36_006474 [Pleurotus pulmonarius]|nr:hypothetical protein EYR36_006474 [Pleurotus pulmonarius]KAF4601174.1 hypothetical protein EYR38_005824 [Pleurotus pulmonarius]
MPVAVRRSSRSVPAKPVPKPATEPKAPAKPKSQPTKKRAASPTRAESPAPKRSRTAVVDNKKTEQPPPTKKPASKQPTKAPAKPAAKPVTKPATKPATVKKPVTKPSPAPEKRVAAPIPQQKPYFNPLPVAPPKQRPGLTLWAWGAGNFGQFGMGPDVLGELDKPRKNPWVEQKIQSGEFGEEGAGLETIAAGGMHTIFVDEKGTVWTCGVNDDAALGRVTTDVPDPENPGSFLSVDDLTSIPHPLQSLIDEKFRAVKIAAGDSISAAVSTEGELRVWGTFRANEGSLGFSSGHKHQYSPVPLLELPHKPGDSEKVSSIASGSNHLLVLTTHGNIYTWGAGEQSQLGRKLIERRKIHGTVPEKVTLGTRSRKAVVIGAGNYHSFAVDDQGDVWGWGLNTMGQSGTGYNSPSDDEVKLPTKVIGLSKEELKGETIVQIAGGEHHTLFLTSGGKVYACGRSNCSQLGLDDDDEALEDRPYPDFVPTPVQVTFPDDDDPIRNVSAGSHNSMAVSEGGALYVWGQGTQGELGVADEEVKTPRVIVRREGGSWAAVQVACGGQHTLGLFRSKK